jgi:hypothetical protein
MRRFMALVAVAAAASFVAAHAGVANAAACGTVTSSTVLTANCDAPLTIGASGIFVDLNGHAVVCNAAVDGIDLANTWSSVRVRNGTVRGGTSTCTNGISVGGDSNQFSSLTVRGATGSGIYVSGNSNGFSSINEAFATDAGFIAFGSSNSIWSSTFSRNSDDGVSFFVGTGGSITNSLVFGNTDKGIISGQSNSRIVGNESRGNGKGIWISDGSTGTKVAFNVVRGNGTGISISAHPTAGAPPATQVTVFDNISIGNTTLDMFDVNANCDANSWMLNFFSTSNQSCIH